MTDLIVVGFKRDKYRASEVLNELKRLDADWVVDLHDAVAVYRDDNGLLRVDQSYQMTPEEGAVWGGIWGSLIGALFAIPVTGGASTAALATVFAASAGGGILGATGGALSADWWKEDFGLSDEFVRKVSTMIMPGDSAIFTLVRAADPAYIEDHFRGWGGFVLRTSLTKEQSDKLEAKLNGPKNN